MLSASADMRPSSSSTLKSSYVSQKVCKELVKLDLGWRLNVSYLGVNTSSGMTQQEYVHRKVTHGDEFENLVNEDDRCTDVQHGFPFIKVERRNGEQFLSQRISDRLRIRNEEEALTVKKGT
jgi:hypothetical protein